MNASKNVDDMEKAAEYETPKVVENTMTALDVFSDVPNVDPVAMFNTLTPAQQMQLIHNSLLAASAKNPKSSLNRTTSSVEVVNRSLYVSWLSNAGVRYFPLQLLENVLPDNMSLEKDYPGLSLAKWPHGVPFPFSD